MWRAFMFYFYHFHGTFVSPWLLFMATFQSQVCSFQVRSLCDMKTMSRGFDVAQKCIYGEMETFISIRAWLTIKIAKRLEIEPINIKKTLEMKKRFFRIFHNSVDGILADAGFLLCSRPSCIKHFFFRFEKNIKCIWVLVQCIGEKKWKWSIAIAGRTRAGERRK